MDDVSGFVGSLLISRNKHKNDWQNFNRANPPPWLQLGATGLDDKRE